MLLSSAKAVRATVPPAEPAVAIDGGDFRPGRGRRTGCRHQRLVYSFNNKDFVFKNANIRLAFPLAMDANIETQAFKVRLDRTDKGQYQLVFAGWGADCDDPVTFIALWHSASADVDPH